MEHEGPVVGVFPKRRVLDRHRIEDLVRRFGWLVGHNRRAFAADCEPVAEFADLVGIVRHDLHVGDVALVHDGDGVSPDESRMTYLTVGSRADDTVALLSSSVSMSTSTPPSA